MRRPSPATLCAALVAAALLPLAGCHNVRDQVPRAIVCGLLATIAYAMLVYRVQRGEGSLRAMVLCGLAARLALLVPAEGLSDDLYRYVWEGRLVAAGENPYFHAPADPVLAAWRDGVIWPRVTHPDVPAAYPPLAQAFFAAVTWFGGGARGMRIALTGIDLLVWLLLACWLGARGLDRRRSVVWGLCPLVPIEVALSGHFDVLAVAACLAALWASAAGRPRAAAALLGVATVCKPYALVLLPLLLTRRQFLVQGVLCVGVVAVAYLPFAGPGVPIGGLARYSQLWEHNAPMFPLLRAAAQEFKTRASRGLERHEVRESIRRIAYDIDPNRLARQLLLLALLLVVWRMAVSVGTLAERSLAVLVAFLLLSPTVHPWYLLWFIPLLAFATSPPLLLWTGSVLLSYHVLPAYDRTGVWAEDPRWRAAEYVPVLGWLLWRAWRGAGPAPVESAQEGQQPADHQHQQGECRAAALDAASGEDVCR